MITLQTSNNSDKYDKLYKAANDLLNFLWTAKRDITTDIGKLSFNASNYKLTAKYTGNSINVTEPESNIIYTLDAESINEIFGVDGNNDYPGLDIEHYDNSDEDALEFKIDTLGEYFNVIGTLGRIHPRFARLPIDEGTFDINLDTRTITPPSGNKVYAVVGDHVAEVIYFSVPRYFDMVDLGSKEVSIIIQTSSVNDKGETKEYLFEAQQRDLDTKPDHVIFGWPISQYITKTTNAITFAIRFYVGSINTNQDSALQYSLGTQPTTIPVLKGLDFRGIGEPTVLPPYLHNYDQTGTTTIEQPVFADFDEPDAGVLNQAVTFIPSITSDSTNRIYKWKYKNKGSNSFEILTNDNIDNYPEMVLNSTKDYTPISEIINEITEDRPSEEDYFNAHKLQLAYDNNFGFKTMVESEDSYQTGKTYYLVSTGSLPLELTTNRGGQYICDVTVRKGRMTATASSNVITISEATDIQWNQEQFETYYPTFYENGYYKNATTSLIPENYINEQNLNGELNFITGNDIINLNNISFTNGIVAYSNVKVQHKLNNTVGETEVIGKLQFYKPLPTTSQITAISTETEGEETSTNVYMAGSMYIITNDNWTINIEYQGSNILQETEGNTYRQRYYILEKNNASIEGYTLNDKITNFNTIKAYIRQNATQEPISLKIIDQYDSFANSQVQSNEIKILYSSTT